MPLTHDERLALINRPFFITTIARSYLWSGTIVGDRFPAGRMGEALLRDDDGITKFGVETLPGMLPSEAQAGMTRARLRGREYVPSLFADRDADYYGLSVVTEDELTKLIDDEEVAK